MKEKHPERVYFAMIDVVIDGQRTGAMVKLPPDGERGFASDEQGSYDTAL